MFVNRASDSLTELSCVTPSLGTKAAHRTNHFALLALLIVALLSVTACGPEEPSTDSNQIEAETIRIAQAYAQDGDPDRARVSLQGLEVANPMQWLVYQAETAISENQGAPETQALARLAIGLGSQSHSILDFGMRTGLVPADEEPAEEIAQTQIDNAAAEPAEQVEPTSVPQAEASAPEPNTIDGADNAATEEDAGAMPSEPEDAPEPAAEEPEPTATAIPVPLARASTPMNVRGGPGTVYPIVDDMGAGEEAEIVAKNAQSDWWQVKLSGEQLGWVYGQLVETSGDVASIAIAANIPEPPPTPTPAPVVEAPPEAPPEAPAEEPAPAPADDGPDFRMIEKRLWDVYENGGSLSGPTVICGEKRQLVVRVVDPNGSPINGVAIQEEFGAKEIQVTGAQGKGDGIAEFILGRGQDVRVVRDTDGREVTSDVARGMVTEPAGIPYELLIAGQYCTDDESCKKFVDAPGCWGHYSWTVTFQRKY